MERTELAKYYMRVMKDDEKEDKYYDYDELGLNSKTVITVQ